MYSVLLKYGLSRYHTVDRKKNRKMTDKSDSTQFTFNVTLLLTEFHVYETEQKTSSSPQTETSWFSISAPFLTNLLPINLIHKLVNCISIINLPTEFHSDWVNSSKVIVQQIHIKHTKAEANNGLRFAPSKNLYSNSKLLNHLNNESF